MEDSVICERCRISRHLYRRVRVFALAYREVERVAYAPLCVSEVITSDRICKSIELIVNNAHILEPVVKLCSLRSFLSPADDSVYRFFELILVICKLRLEIF